MKTHSTVRRLAVLAVVAVVGLSAQVAAQNLSLTMPTPAVPRGFTFRHSGAGYDAHVRQRWRIDRPSGYVSIGFEGHGEVIFSALGSSFGFSRCRIDVYVNGQPYWRNVLIDRNWNDYLIPASAFGYGHNTVMIQLVGRSALWLDNISVRRFEPERRRFPAPPPPRVPPPRPRYRH